MTIQLSLLINVIAVAIISYGLYFRRHRRRDMLVSYVALNIGVMIVSIALVKAHTASATGLGLGLFGVLSIIRLRSSEMRHEEIAYYFASLTLGLLCGVRPDPVWVTPTLAAALVLVMFVVDHPNLHRTHRQQFVTLDKAYTDEPAMIARLAELLRADILSVTVQRTDLVRDTTVVDVRYRIRPDASPASSVAKTAGAHERLTS